MKKLLSGAAISAAFLGVAHGASDHAIPDIAQALLAAAYETGDPAEVAAVARAVKAVFPDYADAIDDQTTTKIAELTPPPQVLVAAEDKARPKTGILSVRPWDGKIQASANFADGNSDNSAIGLAIDAARSDGDFTHNVKAYIDLARSNDETSQKRWGGEYQLDYTFNHRAFAYGRFSYDEDAFSGFDYRIFVGGGLGYFLSESDAFKWKVEGGPGFRYSPIDITREVEQEIAVYGASEMDWIIRPGVKLEQDLFTTWTAPTTTFQSVTALTTDLTDSLSTALSFEYRYETDPPEGRVNADRIGRASLIYGF